MRYSGNAKTDARKDGWFLGWFQREEGGRPELYSEILELKWGEHTPQGPKPLGNDKPVTTITILVKGTLRLIFPDTEFLLQRPGDFVLWGPGDSHSWEVLEDSLVFTVRWPSIKG